MRFSLACQHSSTLPRWAASSRPALIAAALALLAGCAAVPDADSPEAEAAREGYASVEDLHIVDCLLPGQVRRLGGRTYVTPRRPTRTTAQDCRIRGGEYVAYDRADYRSALNVWLERAEDGDAEAQNYVGEIFEKGLGQEPDYESAATWYQRAAEQDFARAQINLGFLYEQGLGVERDAATALNWYRRASGVEDDDIVYRSEADAEVAALREELTAELNQASDQVAALQSQLERMRAEREELERRLEEARQAEQEARAEAEQDPDGEVEIGEIAVAPDPELEGELAATDAQIESLEGLFQEVENQREALAARLEELPEPEPETQAESPALAAQAPTRVDGVEFGRYYALVIGNQDYQHLEDLRSPISDGRLLKRVLEERYGFSVLFVPNADQAGILNALNDLYEQVEPEDNLLIYYAGHGNRSQREDGRRARGYWLPVDAEADRLVRWINNAVISDHLDRIRARSILVVADSLFAATLISESSPLLLGSGAEELTEDAIRRGLGRRARVVISSGGEKPLLDERDPEHSLFARSLIDVLEENDGVLREDMLFARVAVGVRQRSDHLPEPRTPEMRPIRAAGHEGGDFYLVPVPREEVSRVEPARGGERL